MASLRSALLFLLVVAWQTGLAACLDGQKLRILHFNDFHGQLAAYDETGDGRPVAGIARLAAAVRAARDADPARPTLLLFAGDLLQGTVTSSGFLGLPDVALFDRLGVDAAALGNHDLDYGQDVLRGLAGRAGFPILSANVGGGRLPLAAATVLARPGMARVAVIGLTTGELATATHPRNAVGLAVEDPLAAAARQLPALRERADLVVALSHLGAADDRRLARALPDLDLIVGGHSHDVFRQPERESGVAIVQAGARGRWLGELDLDCRAGRFVATAYRLLDLGADAPEDPAVAAQAGAIVAEAERGLDEVIGTNPVPLSADRAVLRRGEGVFGDFVADLARELTGADVALVNGGGFRADIGRGPVTLKQVYQSFPFGNELLLGRVTGAQLLAALARSASLDPATAPGGFLQVSGLRYRIEAGRLAAARVAGRPIDPGAVYTVVLPDFLAAGGDGYAMLAGLADVVPTGRRLADLVIEAFRAGHAVPAAPDGRIERD
ncbi:bifunctional metallophosphatase/5'-nucleotidase [Parasulfuritortus cantonensis]|uniref:Bifunctional metallophosphatase/5'-nucleotidase n=1 Tax=Parasulfuritortus cantonensis TaxID=2528202 RepID=A0A4R1B7D2_9PROT|nr:bifunctional UDP-sugar hydrolase/5'-nucleotidase [Parasulfuritortus cantonensis]TCJ11663.1 bifunctional metallophosphatase/5'-nucleotidase [Parasulfuritortus cantonensis]